MQMKLYRYIPVFRRADDGVVLYRVFEVHGLGYVVQSQDFYRPGDQHLQAMQLESQFLELFMEQKPEDRSGISESIEEAIAAFDLDFGDVPETALQ